MKGVLMKLETNRDKFCPEECNFLSPTEAEQQRQTIKDVHRCGKYGVPLIHGEQHPDIYKCKQCFDKGDMK